MKSIRPLSAFRRAKQCDQERAQNRRNREENENAPDVQYHLIFNPGDAQAE
jgi:hypothetical protein